MHLFFVALERSETSNLETSGTACESLCVGLSYASKIIAKLVLVAELFRTLSNGLHKPDRKFAFSGRLKSPDIGNTLCLNPPPIPSTVTVCWRGNHTVFAPHSPQADPYYGRQSEVFSV